MEVAINIALGMLGAAFLFALLFLIEFVAPNERISIATRMRAWGFWFIAIPVNALVVMAMGKLWQSFGAKPLFVVPIGAGLNGWGWAALIIAPILAAMLNDFFFYWFHRAEHAFLWRFHAVHHSIRDLHGGSGYHHLTEPFFRFVLMTVPASLMVTDVSAIVVVSTILSLQQLYVHSSTSADLGWGRMLFVDNRFHRIHHSLDERHFDKNFGAMTTLWDRLFGTAYWPAKDEWPAVGLAEIDEPRSVREYLDLPLRFGREAERVPDAISPLNRSADTSPGDRTPALPDHK